MENFNWDSFDPAALQKTLVETELSLSGIIPLNEAVKMTVYALEPVEDYSGRQVEVISRMISPEAAKDIDAEKLLFVGQKTARFVEGALSRLTAH